MKLTIDAETVKATMMRGMDIFMMYKFQKLNWEVHSGEKN
jgi:hypothetical protein